MFSSCVGVCVWRGGGGGGGGGDVCGGGGEGWDGDRKW